MEQPEPEALPASSESADAAHTLFVPAFADIEADVRARVARDRCCTLATLDTQGRVRSRVVHPLWEGALCWLLTDRRTPKVRHIRAHPYVSLSYSGDPDHPLYAECRAEWVEDRTEIRRVWALFAASPLGYNPALFYGHADHPTLGVVKLTSWRVQIDDSDGLSRVWQPKWE